MQPEELQREPKTELTPAQHILGRIQVAVLLVALVGMLLFTVGQDFVGWKPSAGVAFLLVGVVFTLQTLGPMGAQAPKLRALRLVVGLSIAAVGILDLAGVTHLVFFGGLLTVVGTLLFVLIPMWERRHHRRPEV